jgi:hypothetical protein
MLGVIGFVILIFLPGAWITFGLPLRTIPFWVRLVTGAVLAPFVVFLEFYAVRFAGVPFESTAILLIFINLPALYLIYRGRPGISFPNPSLLLGWALALAVAFAFLAPQIVNPQMRSYTGHAWMHTDVAYMLANGELRLQDPELAGISLAYPWAGHAYQGILSYLVKSPPPVSFIWTNLFWLLFIYALCAGIVGELGGNSFARVTSIIWLSFGVNAVGFVLEQVAERLLGGHYFFITGDPRYTPWLRKFFFFEQEPYALAIVAALAYLTVRSGEKDLSRTQVVLAGSLLCAIAILYPVLFPAAAAIVVAKVIALIYRRFTLKQPWLDRQVLSLAAILVGVGILELVTVQFLSRHTLPGAISISGVRAIVRKGLTCAVVTSPLLTGLALVVRRYWRQYRSASTVLILSALASFFFYSFFSLRGVGGVDYKFMLTAAICLAPFPSLALQPVMNRLGWKALPAYALVTFFLAFPVGFQAHRTWPWLAQEGLTVNPPRLDISGFDLRLDEREKFSGLTEAIRARTPVAAILVLENSDLHFPTLTRRRLYVPPDQVRAHPGVNIKSISYLTKNRGYDERMIMDRRQVVRELFESENPILIAKSLARIMDLKRPVAIILEQQRHGALLDWLTKTGMGSSLYEDKGFNLWLVLPKAQ